MANYQLDPTILVSLPEAVTVITVPAAVTELHNSPQAGQRCDAASIRPAQTADL